MYDWWLAETTAGRPVRPVDLAARASVTNSAAANAIRRYRAGRIPTATNPGLSARTVTSVHVMLSRAFRDATAWRYILANPVAAAEPPRVETGEHRTWTAAQLTTFLELASHDRLYAMWLLLATTGVRRSEVAGLRRDALDSLRSTITITTTRVIAAGKAHASSGKTRRSRRLLALDTATTGALTAHLATVEQERRAWGLDYQDHGLMFCWPDGRPLYPDTITEQFGKLVDRARLPHIRLHDVRHTYATMALRAGVNPKIVSTRLGHATVAFTLDTYTADVPDLDRAAAEQITGLFLPRPQSGLPRI
jgi:integrase